jgi:uracil-DNA glycosylase
METQHTVEQWRATTTRKSVQSTGSVLVVDPMPRPDKLERLYRKLRDDEEFKHLSETANFVPGDGTWPAPTAMLIGEAPGAHEDKLCKPFVGRSGNFLDNCMWDAGLKRADCFITNVVKWRPPANRTPTALEIELSIPYLRKEVTTVLPDGGIIVLLGAVPLNMVDPDRRIGKCHGEPFTNGKWTFIPMYHPSFVMRPTSPFGRADYMKDWAKIKELRAA